MSAEYLLPSEAGRQLGLSSAGVKYLEQKGHLSPLRTRSGHRLYPADQIERVARERKCKADDER